MPPRPLRLPFYRNAGGAGEKPAPEAVICWQASRRERRVRSAESDRHAQLQGAHHRGPRAESSSPPPGHTEPRAPASSARWPTAAPPARRLSPPGRGGRQRAVPASRLQVRGPEPGAGSAWSRCRSPSSPLAAGWSIATKRRTGSRPVPRSAGGRAWLRAPTPRRSAAPVPSPVFNRPPVHSTRRAPRLRYGRAGGIAGRCQCDHCSASPTNSRNASRLGQEHECAG
jgi:hypothetical protein